MINQCNFIGNLGQDPEFRTTTSGTGVVNFSVACSESWKDKNTGEQKSETEWVNAVAFGRLAEICNQYLAKGSKVYISGKMKTRSWDDKETGQKKYKTEIQVFDMKMLDSKSDSHPSQAPRTEMAKAHPSARKAPAPIPELAEDEIPF